jgi:hypothetical protein
MSAEVTAATVDAPQLAGESRRATSQRRTVMKKQTLLKRATAAALLTVTLAAPAVAGLTAGTASARPIESPNCQGMLDAFESSLIVARAARAQGDMKAYREYMADAGQAKANYNRHCLG